MELGGAVKALIIDDHPLFRKALHHVLQLLGENWTFLEAESGATALELLRHTPDIDLILLDLKLPDMNGLDCLDHFKKLAPSTPVIILSATEDPSVIRRALELEAKGFITKSSTDEVMHYALKLVLAGGTYIPNEALSSVPGQDDQEGSSPYMTLGLTRRQEGVIRYVIKGLSNKQIAREMNLSENTVRGHLAQIFKTLGVNNRTEVAFTISKLNSS